jgi:hypothetical protein
LIQYASLASLAVCNPILNIHRSVDSGILVLIMVLVALVLVLVDIVDGGSAVWC